MTKDYNTEQAVSELPPLPVPASPGDTKGLVKGKFFTADQMREYALSALSQVRGKAQEPVAWMWKMHGWAVTAHGKNHAVKIFTDVFQPPRSTQESPDFIELVPLYAAAPQVAQEEGAEPVAWYDPRNVNPGQSVTFKREVHAKWPHLYPKALYEAPQPDAQQSEKDVLLKRVAAHLARFNNTSGYRDGEQRLLDDVKVALAKEQGR